MLLPSIVQFCSGDAKRRGSSLSAWVCVEVPAEVCDRWLTGSEFLLGTISAFINEGRGF